MGSVAAMAKKVWNTPDPTKKDKNGKPTRKALALRKWDC